MKAKFKNIFTPEKLFWFRLSGVILVFLFLVWNFILVWKGLVYNKPGTFPVYSYDKYTGKWIYNINDPRLISFRFSLYYSYFTTQTNYIVFFYFVFYLFHKKFKGTKPDYLVRLGVTVYITMTMVVFWSGLFVQGDIMDGNNFYSWSSTIVLHAIIPISMIVSYIATVGEGYYRYEKHHKSGVWLIALYPALYFIFIMLRGEILHQSYPDFWNLFQGDSRDPFFYPYFFLDYSQTSGWEIFASGSVMVFVLCIGLQYFYIMLNNFVFFKTAKKENKINIDKIKLWSKVKKYKILSKKTRSALIINFITSCLNLLFAFFFFAFRGLWNKYLGNQYNTKIIFAFSTIIIVFSFFCIIFGILAWFGLFYARIILGYLNIAMMCFNWIWIVGPLLDAIIAFICLSEKKWSKEEYNEYIQEYENKIKKELENLKV